MQQAEHREGECVLRVRADVVREIRDRVSDRDDLVLIDSAGGASLDRFDQEMRAETLNDTVDCWGTGARTSVMNGRARSGE